MSRDLSKTARGFQITEATIDDIHRAYAAGSLTARELTQGYLDRIAAYDQQGPKINAVISLNPRALDDAGELDAAYAKSGLTGPLHGIPVLVKDQADVKGLATTLGSVLFKDYYPDSDSFVVANFRKAGAIILGKATLGEFAAGDAHGSLFGSTRNPYDLDRTVGGSSGGSAAAVAASFSTIAIAQEGFASIRRPAIWNSIPGIRPTAGLVSRTGVFSGWPEINGTLGPMARTVGELAVMLDVMVGYDAEDPVTARGIGNTPETYTSFLDKNGLKGARIGVLRESFGYWSEPDSDDFRRIENVFNRALGELKDAGVELVDPIVIPKMAELLATRAEQPGAAEEMFKTYFGRSAKQPHATRADVAASPDFEKVTPPKQQLWLRGTTATPEKHYAYLLAREELLQNMLTVMADNKLDAIVHKAVEHSPTLIADGIKSPWMNQKGAPHINTFLVFVPSIVVPAGFTSENLPAGICFLGRPYDDGGMLKLAYAYEQETHHRKPPAATP